MAFLTMLLICGLRLNAFAQTEHEVSQTIDGVTYTAYYLEWWDDNNNFWVQLLPKGGGIGPKNIKGISFSDIHCGDCGRRIDSRNVSYANWVGRNFCIIDGRRTCHRNVHWSVEIWFHED